MRGRPPKHVTQQKTTGAGHPKHVIDRTRRCHSFCVLV